jgi:hypothetical protein
MSHYTLQACENYIDKYVNEYGGECTIIEDGVLGLGTLVLHSAKGRKAVVIKEVYKTAWSSSHIVRMYKTLPNKYQKLIDKI